MGAGHGCYNLMAWSLERIEIFNREESRCGGEAAVENQLWLCVRGGRNMGFREGAEKSHPKLSL